MRFRERIARPQGPYLVETLTHSLAEAARLHPLAKPQRHGLRVATDVPYVPGGLTDHLMDVYFPAKPSAVPKPCVLYVHGGGFRTLSKESHWVMGLAFGRAGYPTFVINYRRTPEYKYPAALIDCADAYRWVHRHAARYGGDPRRIIVAGESAGANLAVALTLALCYRRPEPFAERLYRACTPPYATVPHCGFLHVSDIEHLFVGRWYPRVVQRRVEMLRDCYLEGANAPFGVELADPLPFLERGDEPARPLPPFFLSVGSRDILLPHTERLEAALQTLRVPVRAEYYRGEGHAFMAFVWRRQARQAWQDTHDFLDGLQAK